MSNGLEQRFGRGRIALALPLLGLVLMWLVFLGAQISDLYQQYGVDYGNEVSLQNQFHVSTYLFLVGVAILGFCAVTSRRMAHNLHSTRLERAIRGFSLVAVIASLIICAVFGIGNFMANFMTTWVSYGSKPQAPNEVMRIFNVYLPILLDAGVMLFVILRAFVNRVDDKPAKPAQVEVAEAHEAGDTDSKQAQRSLAWGYATPIVAGVAALLLGLIIADLTRTNLDIWLWVLIHAILGVGVVLGTRFATAAYNFGLKTHHKVGATGGARNLSLILGIIWSAVVTILSFEKSGEAVQKLLVWPKEIISKTGGPVPTPKPTIQALTSLRFLQDFVPAFVLILLAVAGIYLLLAERSREE